MSAAPDKARIIVSLLAAFVISGGFLFVFLNYADSAKVLATLRLASPLAWLACLALCLACALVRYFRLRTVLGARHSKTLLRISAWHGAAIALFPARLGELVLPWLTRRAGLSTFVSGLGVLLLLRALDLGAIIFIGIVAFLVIDGVAGLELALLAAMLIALALTPECLIALGGMLPRSRIANGGRIGDVTARLCSAITTLGRRQIYLLVAQSALLWGFLAAASCVALASVAPGFSATAAALGLAGGSLAFALPVNGIASAGPFEAAYATAAGLAGVGQPQAISAAIILHICAFASALLFAAIAELSARLFIEKRASDDEASAARAAAGKGVA